MAAACDEFNSLRNTLTASRYEFLMMTTRTTISILIGCLVLVSCATHRVDQIPLKAVQCADPRPQICTMDYTPVCATRDSGSHCATTACEPTETATYANACMACADPAVRYHLPAACESSTAD